jgi:uncharacterized protein YbaP (TraB family)
VLDEVLVTGEQPGPSLWKISKGDHVMWVLGTYGPLPKKMTWRSKEVEAAIARSQVYLLAGSARFSAGSSNSLLKSSAMSFRDNPNNAQLKDVLSRDLYARWRVLKEKYIGSSNAVEKWRPFYAAQELYQKALDEVGLEQSRQLRDGIEKIAKKAKIKIVNPGIELPKVKLTDATIKEFKAGSFDDLECFTKTIERLETDLSLMRARANAWAKGDVAAIRELTHVDQATACIAAFSSAQFAQEWGWNDVPERVANAWLAAAEEALANNKSTFAVLDVDEFFGPDGVVAKLRERGYRIEEPQD